MPSKLILIAATPLAEYILLDRALLNSHYLH